MNPRYSRFLLPSALLLVIVVGPPTPQAVAQSNADATAGALLFRDKGCAYCHGAGGIGTKKAPSLVNIRDDKEWTAEKMTGQILDGGDKMPPFRDSLSDEEIAKLVAYLRAKNRPVPPPLPNGAAPPPPGPGGP